jgi:hypothetical protein
MAEWAETYSAVTNLKKDFKKLILNLYVVERWTANETKISNSLHIISYIMMMDIVI